jgi:uncharacterized repeat protein (TIGR01451 family)
LNCGTVTLTIGNLAAGASGSATLLLGVSSRVPAGVTSIDNTASIVDDSSNGSDPTPLNNTASDSDALIAAVDLTLVKGDGVTTAAPGATLTYTLGYANVGEAPANGVVITDSLPAGTSFDAAINPGWTLNGTNLTFTVGALAAGGNGTATLILAVAPSAPAGLESIFNTATIGDNGATGPDPTPLDNTATDTDTLAAAPDLTITKSDGMATATAGDTLTYTLNYTNAGNQNATGVVITDTLPAGTSFDAAMNPGWTLNSSTLTFSIGAVAAGGTGNATLVLAIDASIPAGQTSVINTATIADDAASGSDSNPADNSATDTDTLTGLGVDLALTITDGATTVLPGGAIVYTLNYSNTGNQTASGVVITERLPAGTTFNAGASTTGWTQTSPGVFELTVGTLGGGGSDSAMFAVSVINPAAAGLDTIVNSASIADDGTNGVDPTPANNAATDTNALNAAPDLAVTKTATPYAAARNGLVTYSLAYSNSGNHGATGVFITESLPANMSFVAAGSTAGWTETSPGSGTYRFDVGSLASGGSGTVAFQVRVASTLPGTLQQFTNTATIGDDAANGADPNSANNTGSASIPIYHGIYVVALGRSDSRTLTVANAGSEVKVYDAGTGVLRLDFMAYEADAKRGVHVAVGDFNGDGFDDIVTSYGSAGGRIRVFDGVTGNRLSIGGSLELNPFSGGQNYGAFVAVGDVTGDGRPDIVASEGGRGNRVVVYNGVTAQTVTSFQPFGNVSTGVRVAVGDTNDDGRADVITSLRTGGGAVKVFSGTNLPTGGGSNPLLSFDTGMGAGVFVGAANVTGRFQRGDSDWWWGRVHWFVVVLAGHSGTHLRSVNVFGIMPAAGIRLAAVDVDFDGVAEIIAGSGLGGTGEVRFVDGQTGDKLQSLSFRPFSSFPELAVRVAGTAKLPSALVTT